MSDCCSKPPAADDRDRRALRRSMLGLTVETSDRVLSPGHASEPDQASCCAADPTAAKCGCATTASTAEDSCCGGKKGRPDFLLWGSLALFAAGIAVHLLVAGAPGWLHAFGQTCADLAVHSWWGVLFGIVAVAIVGRLPRELVAAVLGRGGSVSGLFRAVAAGVLLDLCNHGILMVAMGLYKRGASLGQTLAFLIASPWNSFSLTLILAALIGWKWMLLFIALSMVVALITGWIVDRMVGAGLLPPNPNAVDLPHDYRIGPSVQAVLRSLKPGRENYLQLLKEGLAGSQMVLRWIFFGFVLTGLIGAFVPEHAFQHYFGPTALGMLLTLIATTLLEVCSEGSSPIAAHLLTRAHAPGNAFVFLMAGAATDYTEVMSLRSTTKSWKAALALPLISTPQVLLIGWLIQHFSK